MNKLKESDKNTSDHLVFPLEKNSQLVFDKIFIQFYASLCLFAKSIIHDDDQAEDIVQDVMFKFWNKKADFLSLESIKSFLYISVKNSCFNILDKEKVKAKHENFIRHSNLFDEDNALKHIIKSETIRQIAEVLETLPPQCKKIIKMSFQDELKPKEIALELGITISSVNNQKMRGLSLLKERLSGQDFSLATVLLVIHFRELF